MRPVHGFLIAACPALFLTGCASEAERPTEDMTRAATLISQAEKAGAQQYASAELQQARDHLSAANKAVEDGKEDKAKRLAQQASVDAELANARTASGQAQRAAEEVSRGTNTLQQEADRTTTTPTAPDATSR